jgi:hypothetical protein
MTDQKTGTGYGQRRELPVVLIVVGMVVVAATFGALIFFGTGGSNPAASGTITAGSPAGPNIFAPDMRKMNFSQLVDAGYLDTPEEIQQFMINYPFKYDSTWHVGWLSPDQILRANGKGNYVDFANFFGEALIAKGCWGSWNPREATFGLIKDNKEYGTGRDIVTFVDIRNGTNAYFVPDPATKFPIIYNGKEDPLDFEAKRLGAIHDPTTGDYFDFC